MPGQISARLNASAPGALTSIWQGCHRLFNPRCKASQPRHHISVLAGRERRRSAQSADSRRQTCCIGFVYERLDGAGVLHNDSNPLNLMVRGTNEWRMVDFGFSKKIDKKRHKENPNLRMSLQTLLHSGTRGLINTHKITVPPALLLAALEQNKHRPVMPGKKQSSSSDTSTAARGALSPVNRRV